MTKQHLTAVFALRPSKRKAVLLERARAQAEAVYWQVLGKNEGQVKAIAQVEDAKDRRKQLMNLKKPISRAVNQKLHEPIAAGLNRDVMAAISSYIGLYRLSRKSGENQTPPEWPSKGDNVRTNHEAALNDFVFCTDREQENALRDELNRVHREPPLRPMTLARMRDARIIRIGETGALAVELNIVPMKNKKARLSTRVAGKDAVSKNDIKASKSRSKILVPLSCSKWHEQKFLNGNTKHRSSLIVRKGSRWFLLAQFEMTAKPIPADKRFLGVDRGVKNPVALALADDRGQVKTVIPPLGREIGQAMADTEDRRRKEQKRRGRSSLSHYRRVDHLLHSLANKIVAIAKQQRAMVVIENLDSQKKIITKKRQKGSARRGWRKILKRTQLGKLERILAYKLALQGLPAPRPVFAAGTSVICPACGMRATKNRKSQDNFTCVTCGFIGHADSVAAVNIARRGAQMTTLKKGEKLEQKNKIMVAALRHLDDGGLGPLGASAEWIVAGRAAAENPDACFGIDRSQRGKNSPTSNQNT